MPLMFALPLRCERLQALALVDHALVVAVAGHVDAEDLRLTLDIVGLVDALHRGADLVGADQHVQRARRELAEDVDEHPRVVPAIGGDLFASPLNADALAALRVVGIGADLLHPPGLVAAGRRRAIERAGEMRRVAGHDDVTLDAARQRSLGGSHHGVGHAADLVEDEHHIVGVEARERVRLLLRVGVGLEALGGHEPLAGLLLGVDAVLLPDEQPVQEPGLIGGHPFDHLGPEAVVEVLARDGDGADFRPGPCQQEVPTEPSEAGRLADSLRCLHGLLRMLLERPPTPQAATHRARPQTDRVPCRMDC